MNVVTIFILLFVVFVLGSIFCALGHADRILNGECLYHNKGRIVRIGSFGNRHWYNCSKCGKEYLTK